MGFIHLNKRQNHLARILLISSGLGLLILSLWLPFKMTSGDIQENWHIRTTLLFGIDEYENVGSYIGELALTRPIARILFWIAYHISPDSFLGDNILLMILLWLKALAVVALSLSLFPRRYYFAFLLAALVILYPIDTGVVSLRIPHIHFGIAAYLFAVYCLVSYWKNQKSRYLYGASFFLILACLSYEVFYPLILASPLLLVVLQKGISKRLIRTSIAWYIAPALSLAYSSFFIFVKGFGFQSASFQGGLERSVLVERALLPYRETLFSVWKIFEAGIAPQWTAWVLPIAILFFLFSGVIYLLGASEEKGFNRKEYLSWFIGALLFIGLGFLVLVPTDRAEYQENYRVYLTSSVGAAAFFLPFAYQIAVRIPRYFGVLLLNFLLSFFIALSLNYHLTIHQSYVEVLSLQGVFYRQLSSMIPVNAEAKTLIIIPEGGTLQYDFGIPLKPHIFTASLQYLYESTELVRFAFICTNMETQCLVRNGQRINAHFDSGRRRYEAEDIILYELSADGTLRLLTTYPGLPEYQLDASEFVPVPRRLSTVFGEP